MDSTEFEKRVNGMSRDDRFRATVYAINTLLIHKGVYTKEEMEGLFLEWADKHAPIDRRPLRAPAPTQPAGERLRKGG